MDESLKAVLFVIGMICAVAFFTIVVNSPKPRARKPPTGSSSTGTEPCEVIGDSSKNGEKVASEQSASGGNSNRGN